MSKARWARVLIVEDSPTAGRVLSEGISRDSRLAVAGVATTAKEAMSMAILLKPDVMTLDLMLPDQNGLGVIRNITEHANLPIIVVTSLPAEGADSLPFQALEAGATDVVAKPNGDAASLRRFFDDLNERLKDASANFRDFDAQTRAFMKESPFVALAAAIAGGFLLGRLLSRL